MIHSNFDTQGIWINQIEGTVDLLDLFDTAFKWYEHPQYKPTVPVLWDARNGFLAISYQELITNHLNRIARVNSDRPDGKTAWLVAHRTTLYILEEIIRQVTWAAEWRAFLGTEPTEAIEWLRPVHTSGS